MTGFGHARAQNDRLAVDLEIRSVNNKHLKVSVRCPDSYLTLENELEKLVREEIGRGTVYVNLRADRLDHTHLPSLDPDVLKHYWTQVVQLADELQASHPSDLSGLLPLPGVVSESRGHLVEEQDWPLVKQAADAALEKFQEFRRHEGVAMAKELGQSCAVVSGLIEQVSAQAPTVVAEYRSKILARVSELLENGDSQIEEKDVIREVSIFADRCDITEEITRLQCHVEQFRSQLDADSSPGRKLDFLCQEMFREINTIGSKANDVTIAHHVVDAKTTVEKMREIVQNIE